MLHVFEKHPTNTTMFKCKWHKFSVGHHSEWIAQDGDSNLRKHFKRKHKDVFDKLENASNAGLDMKPLVQSLIAAEEEKLAKKSLSKYLQSACGAERRRKVVTLCLLTTAGGVSQNFWDSELAGDLFQEFGQDRNVAFSRRTREQRVMPAIHKAVTAGREEKLASLQSKVFSVTTDSWTSFNHKR
jgi:hypothetical protein